VFSVQTESLFDLARTLGEVEQGLESMKALSDLDAHSAGSRAVSHAVKDIIGNWSQGIGDVTTATQQLQQLANGAGRTYDETETAIRTAAQQGRA
jgi:hypothetical protein